MPSSGGGSPGPWCLAGMGTPELQQEMLRHWSVPESAVIKGYKDGRAGSWQCILAGVIRVFLSKSFPLKNALNARNDFFFFFFEGVGFAKHK